MSQSLIFLTTWAVLLPCAAATAGGKAPPRAGWFGVFPRMDNFSIRYQQPIVAEGKDPKVYSQEAFYDEIRNWNVSASAVLARDPEFKTKYAAETMKQEGAVEVMIGKRTGWLRAAKQETLGPSQELIVPLSDDKALILKGVVHFEAERLVKFAGLFNLAKVEEALAKPPQTEFKKDKQAFHDLPTGALWYDEILAWLGSPDRIAKKGIYLVAAEYDLPGGKCARLFISQNKLTGVAFLDKAEEKEDEIDWFDLFPPPRQNYTTGPKPPVVFKGKDAGVYHMTVQYVWLGNDSRSATATMARDPEFKTKYAAETMKKEGAKEITVGETTAWVRLAKKDAVRECELIVPLSEDKALILASHGNYGGEAELTALAAGFTLKQVEAALAKPPVVKVKKD